MEDLLKQLMLNPPHNGSFYTIAIDGRAGSGKTTLAMRLQELLPDFVHLHSDDYFEPTKDKLVWGAFNDERFIKEVLNLCKKIICSYTVPMIGTRIHQ